MTLFKSDLQESLIYTFKIHLKLDKRVHVCACEMLLQERKMHL